MYPPRNGRAPCIDEVPLEDVLRLLQQERWFPSKQKVDFSSNRFVSVNSRIDGQHAVTEEVQCVAQGNWQPP